MSTPYPKIVYPASGGSPTTLNFTLPPLDKPGPYPIADQESVGGRSVSLSGLVQTMFVREDTFLRLKFPDVPWADMSAWTSFIDYAHQGGTFLYYPDQTGTAYDEYWLEDSGGSGRSSAPLDAWSPDGSDKQHAMFNLVLRKKPGGMTHA